MATALLSCPIISVAATMEMPDMTLAPPVHASGLEDVMAAALRGDPAPARALLVRQPMNPAAHELLGIALATTGDLPGAKSAFEAALRLAPEQYTALTKLGDLALATGDFDAARIYFNQALNIAPMDRLIHQRLGYLDAMDGLDDSAIQHYEAGLQGTPPDYLGIKRDLAALYNRRGDHGRALALLASFAQTSPPAPGVATIVAEALNATGKPEEATALLRRAATSDFAAAIALAKAETSRGNLVAAETVLGTALNAMPTEPELAFELGALRGLQRDYEGAAAAFVQGLQSAPHNPALLRGAMQAQSRLGDTEAALALADRLAVNDHPGDLFLIANIQTHAGRTDAAEDTYRRLLILDTGNVPALNNLSILMLVRGEVDEAVSLARKAVDAAPELAMVHDSLGQALLRQGEPQAAADAFERAVELAPDRQDYMERLQEARRHP